MTPRAGGVRQVGRRPPDAVWLLLVVSVLAVLGGYVAVRAWVLSFTHDESLSYFSSVQQSLSAVLLSHGTDSNNHPLNTVAMKVSEAVLGQSEVALRWASVVAFVVYVVSLVVLLRRVERRSLRALGLALAVASPYVLDFFSLARGYGLALALVAASALFTLDFAERPTAGRAAAATGFAAAAAVANFSTLTYVLAVLGVIVVAVGVPARTGPTGAALARIAAAVSLPVLAVVLLVVVPLLRLRSEGELYFGGERGFWRDTVYSLVDSTLYRRGWDVLAALLVVLVAAAVVGGAIAALRAIARRTLPPHAAAFLLLAIPGLVSVAQHFAVGTRFLLERTALFFVPLFAIWLALAADAVARRPRFAAAVTTGAVVITVAACVNLVSAANLSYVLDWRYDATTERVVSGLAGTPGEPRPVALGVSFLFDPTTRFYRETRFHWLPECPSPDCLAQRADYYYVIGPDVALVRSRGARVLKVYATSGGVLARGPSPPG
jgi:hypothetical protein